MCYSVGANHLTYLTGGIPRNSVVKARYKVNVVIQNKPYLDDPEGNTIHKDLIVKGGFSNISYVRTAKLLNMMVDASSEKEAKKTVERLCDELRVFNPIVSECTVTVVSKQSISPKHK
jgi:phosphoribosylformylglycinamidine synthase subunit PurS